MKNEEMKQKIDFAIQETLNSHASKTVDERTSAATVALGMAMAMRLCGLVQPDEYRPLVENIIGSIRPHSDRAEG